MGQERLGPSYFFISLVLGLLNSLLLCCVVLRNTCSDPRTFIPQLAVHPTPIASSRTSDQQTVRYSRRRRAGRGREDVESDDDQSDPPVQPAKVCVRWQCSPPHQHPGHRPHGTMRWVPMMPVTIKDHILVMPGPGLASEGRENLQRQYLVAEISCLRSHGVVT